MFMDFLSWVLVSRLILRMMLAVEDVESEMICLYGLPTVDLAPAHAEVPELREVVDGGPGGPGGGPLRSEGRKLAPMAVAMVT